MELKPEFYWLQGPQAQATVGVAINRAKPVSLLALFAYRPQMQNESLIYTASLHGNKEQSAGRTFLWLVEPSFAPTQPFQVERDRQTE